MYFLRNTGNFFSSAATFVFGFNSKYVSSQLPPQLFIQSGRYIVLKENNPSNWSWEFCGTFSRMPVTVKINVSLPNQLIVFPIAFCFPNIFSADAAVSTTLPGFCKTVDRLPFNNLKSNSSRKVESTNNTCGRKTRFS